MPKIYCPNCYKASIYESTQPGICGYCGKPYMDISNANLIKPEQPKSIVKPPLKASIQRNQITEEEEEQVNVPQIDSLDVQVESNLRPNRELFDSMKNRPPSSVPRPKMKAKKQSKKEIHQQWLDQFKDNNKRGRASTEIT